MMIRKQILVPAEVDQRIRRLAKLKGQSQSAVIVDAVTSMTDSAQISGILAFSGAIKNAPGYLSEQIDDLVYG